MPAEWKREGDVTTVTRYQKFITNIYGMHSLENLPLPLFEAMRDFDVEEADAEKAAIEAAQQGVDE